MMQTLQTVFNHHQLFAESIDLIWFLVRAAAWSIPVSMMMSSETIYHSMVNIPHYKLQHASQEPIWSLLQSGDVCIKGPLSKLVYQSMQNTGYVLTAGVTCAQISHDVQYTSCARRLVFDHV